MWLLDVNIPSKLISLLNELGIQSETAHSRGWDALSNGSLIEAAAVAGFVSLLTRDRLFAEAASRTLKRFPDFSVVTITLPQLRAELFLSAFRAAWNRTPIVPVAGQMVHWPAA